MRRVMLLVVSVLMIVSMAISPAFAHDWDGDGWDEEFGYWVLVPVYVEYDDDDFCYWDDCYGDDDDGDDDHYWYYDGDHDDWNDHEWEGPVHLID